jgi:hypothetical protein
MSEDESEDRSEDLSEDSSEDPNFLRVLDFEREAFTFTWFYRALAVSDSHPSRGSAGEGLRSLDVTDRFLNLWICFNSILRDCYAEDLEDMSLIRCAVNDDLWLDLFRSVNSPEYRRHLQTMRALSPIHDMKRPERLVALDEDSFEELLPFIYQIRGNLFHGRKDPGDVDPSDLQRIELSFLLLTPIIIGYMRQAGMITVHLQSDFEYEWIKEGIWFEF